MRSRPRALPTVVGAALALALVGLPAPPASASWLRPSAPVSPGELTNAQREEVVESYDASGELVSTQVIREAYDARGRLVTSSREKVDVQGDQTSLYTVANTYDSGRLVSERIVSDLDGAGPALPVVTTRQTSYDQRGLVSEKVTSTDTDGDGEVDETTRIRFSTDVRSRTISATTDVDVDQDGVGDVTTSDVSVYDPRGNVISQTFDYDGSSVGDGTLRSTYTASYGPQSRLLTTASTLSADGLDLLRSSSTFTYDTKGTLLRLVTSNDGPEDGDQSTQTSTYTYDAKGRLVATTDTQSAFGVVTTSTTLRTYDAKGRLVEAVRDDDFETDGIIDTRSTQTLTYDDKGRVQRAVYDYFTGVDDLTAVTTLTYAYTRDSTVITYEFDTDADGDVDGVEVVTRVGY